MRGSKVRFLVITKTSLTMAVLLVLALVALVAYLACWAVPVVSDYLEWRRADVVLDAGHGGVDAGAHDGNGVLEKDIVLDVVLRMRDYLEAKGLAVELTRETDTDVSGFERYRKGRHRQDLINRVKILDRGQVAVSIHVNTLGDSSASGAVIFYAKGSEEGKILAEHILQEIGKVQHLNHTFAIPRTNIYVLRNTKVPVVLVELGFVSNLEDKAKLVREDYRQSLAEAVGNGILQYFSVDKPSAGETE